MPYDCEVYQKDGYLLFVVSGDINSIEDVALLTQDIVTSIPESGCYRIMIDERAILRGVGEEDFTLYADHVLNQSTLWLKTAAIYAPEDVEKYSWVETILQNRAFSYKIFDDMDEAKDWLQC